jgi:hypothetical protein
MLLDCFSDRIRLAEKAMSEHDRELFLALARAFYGTGVADDGGNVVWRVTSSAPIAAFSAQ